MGKNKNIRRRKKEKVQAWHKEQLKHGHTKGINPLNQIPLVIPDTTCEYCDVLGEVADGEKFDKNGYPISKKIIRANVLALAGRGPNVKVPPQQDNTVFRFLDLPAEIRNKIYELAAYQPKQPVCVPDSLLRPSGDMKHPRNARRQCKAGVICLPCQLHAKLETSLSGLSWANTQLHSEMALMPYSVNTFSTHNLYYLGTFLKLIGFKGRQSLKSLRFVCRMPEEEARLLKIVTDVEETFTLLLECKSLTKLSMEFDTENMLKWRDAGTPRAAPLSYIHYIPSVLNLYKIRGIKELRIRWKKYPGSQEMFEWAKLMAAYWCLPHGVSGAHVKLRGAEIETSSLGGREAVEWCARGYHQGYQDD